MDKKDRTDRLLPLVSNIHGEALSIFSDAQVSSCLLKRGKKVEHSIDTGRGAYLCVLEGGPVNVNGNPVLTLGAAKIIGELTLHIAAVKDAELLLIDVFLI